MIKFIYTYQVKYQFLINKRHSGGLKYLYDSKAFLEYSNDMDEYNPKYVQSK